MGRTKKVTSDTIKDDIFNTLDKEEVHIGVKWDIMNLVYDLKLSSYIEGMNKANEICDKIYGFKEPQKKEVSGKDITPPK